ncbi:hypothetical protein M5K25_020056 [Dendrobium thyrsiflorum]|uniref:Uncharacterized protein n=1 Tax=Dendrobium thyrsiflorum TaxID=117978 RepID=A0ABD0U8V8_DENTH
MVLRGQGDSPVRICDPCKKLEEAARFEQRYGHKNRATKGKNSTASEELKMTIYAAMQIFVPPTDQTQKTHLAVPSSRTRWSDHPATLGSRTEWLTLRLQLFGCHRFDQAVPEAKGEGFASREEIIRAVEGAEKHANRKCHRRRGEEAHKWQKDYLHSVRARRSEVQQEGNTIQGVKSNKKAMSLKGRTRTGNIVEGAKSNRKGISSKGQSNSKQILKTEDELLGEISGTNGKHLMPSRKEPHMLLDSQGTSSISNASSSVVSDNSGGVCSNSVEGHDDVLIDSECSSPEDLRQQAMEEKKRYRILKAEGKAEEALKAFKHGKDLERQAGALEIAIRKNRRAAGKVSNSSSSSRVSTDSLDDNEALDSQKKVTSSRNKEVKDDLFTELKQLGWSDAELHDAGKKPVKLSLEGELSNLLGETFQKSEIGRKRGGVDNTQVVAHKRKALLLKREGKLAEAKEELKQAKILEKQLEEQELLVEASDSEDELYTLIQNMGNDNQDDLMLENDLDVGANFEHFLSASDDLPIDDNLEVTEDDMNDPEIGDALRLFGWSEQDDQHEPRDASESVPFDEEALQAKILNLKKEALSQKRAGNAPEAMALLKKAKLLEQDLGTFQSDTNMPEPGFSQKTHDNQINAPKSKMVIQKELLALKKKALTLRREGRLEEAEEELKKGKVLEQQLEELENISKKHVNIPTQKRMEPTHVQDGAIGTFDLGVDSAEIDITEQDMHDPAMLSALQNLGWIDDESVTLIGTNFASNPSKSQSVNESVPAAMPWKSMQNKAEIQRELLAIKRKALSLRRQGKTEEAEEELERAKDLEKRLADLESQSSGSLVQLETHNIGNDNSSRILDVKTNKIVDTAKPPEALSVLGSKVQSPETYSSKVEVARAAVSVLPELDQNIGVNSKQNGSTSECVSLKIENSFSIMHETNGINGYRDEILAHKRNALALKREGKLMEAKEELRKAKLLEKSLEEGQESSKDDKPALVSTFGSTSIVQENSRTHLQKPISSRDRFKVQQESLAHKRNALKLRREGKIQEAEAEFEKAKELENQLEEFGAQAPSSSVIGTDAVEDLLDPQLMSALKSIGWDDKDLVSKTSEKPQSQLAKEKVSDQSHLDRFHLEEQIKATKLRALNLKRAGKQDEALEALRSAKKLEKKLGLMT